MQYQSCSYQLFNSSCPVPRSWVHPKWQYCLKSQSDMESHGPFWMMTSDQHKHLSLTPSETFKELVFLKHVPFCSPYNACWWHLQAPQRNSEGNIPYVVVNTVHADGLAPLGARASACTVMTKFGSCIHKGLTHGGLTVWELLVQRTNSSMLLNGSSIYIYTYFTISIPSILLYTNMINFYNLNGEKLINLSNGPWSPCDTFNISHGAVYSHHNTGMDQSVANHMSAIYSSSFISVGTEFGETKKARFVYRHASFIDISIVQNSASLPLDHIPLQTTISNAFNLRPLFTNMG